MTEPSIQARISWCKASFAVDPDASNWLSRGDRVWRTRVPFNSHWMFSGAAASHKWWRKGLPEVVFFFTSEEKTAAMAARASVNSASDKKGLSGTSRVMSHPVPQRSCTERAWPTPTYPGAYF